MTTAAAAPGLAVTPAAVRYRLCVMMFLQYFVQGCYLPIVAVYLQDALGYSSGQIGIFVSALSVGPLLAPFVVGQLVDRRFSTERVLAVCHLLAAAAMFALYRMDAFIPVVIVGTIYSVLYVPTMMLTNSLSFYHLADREREFPLIRLWGTVGFILPAWLIEMVFLPGLTGPELDRARGVALVTSAVAGVLMAAYCLTLPRTPPLRRETDDIAPLRAMRLVREHRFLVLVLVSFFIAIVHQYHFTVNSPFLKSMLRSGDVQAAWEQRISSLGQIAEIGVMIVLGLMLKRLGFKLTMLIGLSAYMLRCLIFAGAARMTDAFALTMTVVCLGQALHGFCFGCFLAAAFIYLDKTTAADLRGSVQTLYGTFVLGLGFFAGGLVGGWVGDSFTTGSKPNEVVDWSGIWLTGAALAAACVAAFAAFFPPELTGSDEDGRPARVS